MLSARIVDLRKGAIAGQRRPLEPRRARRNSPLRAKRRKLRFYIAAALFLLLAGIAYAIHWVSYLPQYSVQDITVVGTQELSPALVRAYVESVLATGSRPFLSPDNIFFFRPAVIAKDIALFFPRIASAKLSRASLLATAVTVSVQERQPFAQWCASDTACYMMDEKGFVYAQADMVLEQPETAYTFSGGIATSTNPVGKYFAPAHLQGLRSLLLSLGQAGFTPQGAVIETDQDFSVPLEEGFELHASFGEDPNKLARDLKLIVSSDALQGKEAQLEYVDLRFGDRAYYKLKGEDAVLPQQ